MAATHSYKRLHQVTIRISHQAVLPFRYLDDGGLDELYSMTLKGSSFQGIGVINLFLTGAASEDGSIVRTGGFLDFYTLFDFSAFQHLPTAQERAQHLLVTIQSALLRLAQQESWPTTRFEQAYAVCQGNKIEANWTNSQSEALEWHQRRRERRKLS